MNEAETGRPDPWHEKQHRDELPTRITLTGDDLTIEQVVAVARQAAQVVVPPATCARMRAARDVVDQRAAARRRCLRDDDRARTAGAIPSAARDLEQISIPRCLDIWWPTANNSIGLGAGHDAGAGKRHRQGRRRCTGGIVTCAGCGAERRMHPVVCHGGSVGEADLSEMAQIAQVLIGLGEADYGGQHLAGASALAAAGVQPISLRPKEALG